MSQLGKYTLLTGTPIATITGDVGTAVGPDALGDVNLQGTAGANITVTGTPASNLLEIALTGTTPFCVQVGDATGSLDSLGAGLNNQFLHGNTGANPSWGAVDLTTDVTGFLPVGSGGTGIGTITDHCLIVGSGVAAVTILGIGTTGQLLVGATAADPAFASSADGNFTFTSATATTQRTLTISNTDNTAVASPANLQVTVGGATNTGDPFVNFLVTGAGTYSVGIDNTVAGDPFKITSGATPSAGTDLIAMTSAGVITLNNDLDVSEGGTGVSTLTSHGILLGNGAGDINATAEPSNGQLLIGKTGDFPVLALPTNGTNISWTGGAGTLTANLTATVGVTLGGTGATTFTAYAVICGGTTATNPLQSIAGVGNAGEVLTSNGAGALPTFQVAGGGGGLTWSVITADLNPMVVDNGYICNKAGLLTVTLPTTCAAGKILRVTGMNTDVGWRIAQSANQQVHFGNLSTTVGAGGYLESTHKRDSVELVCVVADLEFNVISGLGNVTIA